MADTKHSLAPRILTGLLWIYFLLSTTILYADGMCDFSAYPELHYEPKIIAPQDNAVTLWMQAAEAYVDITDPNLLDNGQSLPDRLGTLTSAQIKIYRKWVLDNQSALEKLEEGLRLPYVQFPIDDKSYYEGPIGLEKRISLINVANVKFMKGKLAGIDQDYLSAAEEFLQLIEAGEHAGHGEGLYADLISFALNFQRAGFDGLYWLLKEKRVDEQILLDIFNKIKLYKNMGLDIARYIQLEIKYFIQAKEPADFLEDDSEIEYFDSTYFCKKVCESTLHTYKRVQLPWDPNSSLWNTPMSNGIKKPLEYASDLIDTLPDLAELNELDDAAIEKIFHQSKRAYLAKNPLLTMKSALSSFFNIADAIAIYPLNELAYRNAIRTMLLLTIYKQRHGVYPDSWDEVFAKGLVKQAPMDPFSGKPMMFSNQDQVVSSVGTDYGYVSQWDYPDKPAPPAVDYEIGQMPGMKPGMMPGMGPEMMPGMRPGMRPPDLIRQKELKHNP